MPAPANYLDLGPCRCNSCTRIQKQTILHFSSHEEYHLTICFATAYYFDDEARPLAHRSSCASTNSSSPPSFAHPPCSACPLLVCKSRRPPPCRGRAFRCAAV